jgi:ABC-type transport system involved in Fe-S cluster assembly fused permease/ATPase subunit
MTGATALWILSPSPTIPPIAIDILNWGVVVITLVFLVPWVIFTVAVGWDIHKRQRAEKKQSGSDKPTEESP